MNAWQRKLIEERLAGTTGPMSGAVHALLDAYDHAIASLRAVEWDDHRACPECDGAKEIGHKEGCSVASSLGAETRPAHIKSDGVQP